MSEIFKKLPVQLSEHERALRGEEMAREHAELGRLQELKRDQAKLMKEQIDASEKRIGELAEQVRTGIEQREVLCFERLRGERGMVDLERTDTGEIIDSRPMRPDERQVGMPFDDDTHDDETSSKGPTH